MCSHKKSTASLLFSLLVVTTIAQEQLDWRQRLQNVTRDYIHPRCTTCSCMPTFDPVPINTIAPMFTTKRYTLYQSELMDYWNSMRSKGLLWEEGEDADMVYCQSTFSSNPRMRKRILHKWTRNGRVMKINCKLQISEGRMTDYCKIKRPRNLGHPGQRQNMSSDAKSGFAFTTYTAQAIWADDTTFLSRFCIGPEGHAVWALKSTKTTLTQRQMRIIKKKLKEIGFSAKGMLNVRKRCENLKTKTNS